MRHQFTSLLRISIPICLLIFTVSSCKNPRKKFQTTDSGLKYFFHIQNPDSAYGEEGDYYVLNARFVNMKDSGFLEVQTNFLCNPNEDKPGLSEAVSMMRAGDSASFLLNADTFYSRLGTSKPEALSGQDVLKLELGLVEIMKPFKFHLRMIEKEQRDIKAYIERKAWNATLDTATGIYYEIVSPNPEGKMIDRGDQVGFTFLYSTLNDGIIVRSKEGDLRPMLVGDTESIPGLSTMLLQAREGELIRAVLPFSEAFGKDGWGAYVAPYMTIVVELEVVVVDKPGDANFDILN